jgi:hypothetical protein
MRFSLVRGRQKKVSQLRHLSISVGMLFSAFASIAYGWIKSRLHFVRVTILVCGLMGVGYCIIGNASSYPNIIRLGQQ